MNARKIKNALLIILFLAGVFFNAYSTSKNTRYVIKTEYFDVIYRTPSENTAKLIAQNIDAIYLEIRKSLNVEDYYHFKHFPIYIEYTTQELNAFFTNYPYERITFYDTVPTSLLLVFENSVLSIIQHELTHAVSMNVKNKFNQVLSKIFYDGMGMIFWTAPSSIKEGIAVQNESQNGFGRLNDPFSLHVLRQAKIENKFPKIQEITGARDIYPSGNVPYIFGGAFTDFVVTKYGKEKQRLFLERINNDFNNYPYIYKKTFDQNIFDDWTQFEQQVPLLTLQKNPYQEDGIFDFYSVSNFQKGQKQKNIKQKKLSRVNNVTSFLTKSKSGIAWYNQDSNQVMYSEKNNATNTEKITKLFDMTYVTKIQFSSDGKFLAISRVLSYNSNINVVAIYDMQKRKIVAQQKNLRDAVILSCQNKYYLCAVETLSQNCKIKIFSFENRKLDLQQEFPFEANEVVINLSDAGNFNLSYIKKAGKDYFISLYNIELQELVNVKVPENIVIRDLSSIVSSGFITGQSGILLGFSYGKKDTLPRCGFLSLKYEDQKLVQAQYHLLEKDFSGGVYSPSLYYSSSSQKLPSIVFISKFFDNSKLSVMNTDFFEFNKFDAVFESELLYNKIQLTKENKILIVGQTQDKILSQDQIQLENKKKFNPFEYTFRGIFVPLALVPLYDENLEPVNLAFAGITWHSKGYQIAAGYDPFSYTCGVSANVFNKSTSGNSSFLLSANASFEQNKFRQTEDELSLDYKIPVFTHSNIVLSSDTKYFYGKPDRFKIFQVQPDFSDMQIFFNTQKVLLSSIHKTASNIHQKSGAYVGILQNYAYEEVFNSKLNYGCNFGFTTGFAISSILPFENPNNFCINLPLSVNVELFPDIFNFASCSAKLILFSMEVQKGTKNFFIPLYLNRVYLTGLYKCAVSYSTYQNMAIAKLNNIGTLLKDSTFSDQVGFGANIGFTLNTGDLHQTGCIDIGINVLFDINSPNSKKNNMHLNLSTNLVF